MLELKAAYTINAGSRSTWAPRMLRGRSITASKKTATNAASNTSMELSQFMVIIA
jgi:hypothetical protein